MVDIKSYDVDTAIRDISAQAEQARGWVTREAKDAINRIQEAARAVDDLKLRPDVLTLATVALVEEAEFEAAWEPQGLPQKTHVALDVGFAVRDGSAKRTSSDTPAIDVRLPPGRYRVMTLFIPLPPK